MFYLFLGVGRGGGFEKMHMFINVLICLSFFLSIPTISDGFPPLFVHERMSFFLGLSEFDTTVWC
jgi:hypothetical protein